MAEPDYFWGKLRFDKATGRWVHLSLVDHCLDVAAVFSALAHLPVHLEHLDAAAQRPLTAGDRARLAVLSLGHDLGKTNHGFQDGPTDPRVRAGHIAPLQSLYSDDGLRQRFLALLSDLADWTESPDQLESMLLAS